MRVDLNENILSCVDVHLQEAGSVEWTIQEHHEALVSDVRPGCRDVTIVLGQFFLVVIAVQELKLSPNLAEKCSYLPRSISTQTTS